MEKCEYCRYGGGKHDPVCPESMSGGEQDLARLAWQEGYRKGRDGGKKPAESSHTYTLGYRRGVVALEEAQNGEPFFSSDDIENLDFENLSFDDPYYDPYDPDTIRRTN